MRQLFPITWVFIVIASTSAAAQDAVQELDAARTLWLRGRYAEAAEVYGKLVENNQTPAAAAIGQSYCEQAVGRWEQAVAVLDKVLMQGVEDADLLARRAELALLLGQWQPAREFTERARRLQPDHMHARWVLLRLFEATGDAASARAEREWFLQTFNRSSIKDAESLVRVGRVAVMHAALTLRGAEQAQQLNAVLDRMFDAAAESDPNYWPAIYYSGQLFLEKYRKGDALKDLQRALAINPNSSEIHVAIGTAALNDYEIEAGHAHADRALAINARLPAALHLKADLQMAREQYAEAMERLQQALAINAVDEETLGRVAACYLLSGRAGECDKLSDEVRSRNPRPVIFYTRVAERLEDHRRFDIAEQFFQKALEFGPDRSGPYTGLGLLFMRIGKEEAASEILVTAFEMDPFNARTKNMLEVLDQLESYQTIETKHFRIKVDEQLDGLLGRYAAKYLEEVYSELTDQFEYRPEDRIQIEIFNKGRGHTAHQWFSARTVGLPWIGTVGACTGKVVAMTSPRGVERAFNWARVLKHEVVHVITLQQTRFNIPHWFTEALAVQVEGYPRPAIWNQLLAERVPAGNLFSLDNINLAFARPKTQLDWQMAYCQSELYAEYMQKKFGADSTGRLLTAYRDGLQTADAIERTFQVTIEEFEAGYRKHLESVVEGLRSGTVETPMTRAELERAVAAEPANPDLAARLASEYIKLRNYPKARELALTATKLRKNHALGSFVLARLSTLVGDSERALELLEPALDRNNPDPRVLELLAHLTTQARDLDRARSLYELGCQFFPADSKWVAGVARVALIADNRDALRDALEQLAQLDADDPSPRRKLASMAAEDEDWPRAARFAWMTLHIDVADLDAHRLLGTALAKQQDWRGAADEFRTIVQLRPEDHAAWLELARALHAAGDRDGAKAAVEQLLTKDPENKSGRELLQDLESKNH